jgi:hypothetical protein
MSAWLVPFVTGLIRGFVGELGRPETPQDSAPLAVATGGRINGMMWVAVPFSQTRAFKAEYPKARTTELFFRALADWQFSEPEGWRMLQPFANEVMAAIRQYSDSCQIFILAPE